REFSSRGSRERNTFGRTARTDLDGIFTVQTERVVDKDNRVAIGERRWQIEKSRFRNTLAGCTVTIHEHLDETVSIRYGPHVVGRYGADGQVLTSERNKAGESCGKAGALETVENQPQGFHRSHRPLGIPQRRRDSHFPTAPATTMPLIPIKAKTRKPPSACR